MVLLRVAKVKLVVALLTTQDLPEADPPELIAVCMAAVVLEQQYVSMLRAAYAARLTHLLSGQA